MTKKIISFATGSRADYGIMRNFLSLLNNDPAVELRILATGALLDNKFAHQVDLIYKDGFNVHAELKLPIDSSSNKSVLHTMSAAQDLFADYFESNPCDLLIILGDRYEMLSVAISAAMQRIPILHIHGGEATFGNYDEFIRHCITKMSLYHFTATEEYKNRVIQLGENPSNVFNLGALGAENCLSINEENVPDTVKNLPSKKYFVVLFHPETLTDIDVVQQTANLLDAVNSFVNDYKFVFIGSNADTHSDEIRAKVQAFIKANSNTVYFENLHSDAYHYLVKNSICLIGNSSSGIIEAPSLGVYTINIGDRQAGRVRGNSVIDVECTEKSIKDALAKTLQVFDKIQPENPYYQKDSANRYYATTKELLTKLESDKKNVKVFWDIK